jgi:hypothetical protein
MLFIVIHQVYELWFKLVLHETDKVSRDSSGLHRFDIGGLEVARERGHVGEGEAFEAGPQTEFLLLGDAIEHGLT